MSPRPDLRGSFWPTPLLERLLVAALAPPDEAAAAWRDLPATFDLDRLEPGAFELLPLVYRNLAEAASEDSRLPRLKGIYRRSWVKNNLLLERTRDVAEALRTGGVPVLALEGATFAQRYYPDPGLRPTSTMHLLVRPEDERQALVRLEHGGWEQRPGATYPGWRFVFDGAGNVCLLRLGLAFDFLPSSPAAPAGATLWDAAQEQEVAGKSLRVPCRADAFLSVVVGGVRAAPIPSTQWVVDAAMLLRSSENMDWGRLLEVALAHGQASRLQAAFEYLCRLPVPLPPPGVRATLESARPSRRERLVFALATGAAPALRGLQPLLAEHLVSTREEALHRVVATLPLRLREHWGLTRTRQIPLAVANRVVGRRHMG